MPTGGRLRPPGARRGRARRHEAPRGLRDLLEDRNLVRDRRVVDARPDAVELPDRLAPALECAIRRAEGCVERTHLALGTLQRLVPLRVLRREALDAARPVTAPHGAGHGLEVTAR